MLIILRGLPGTGKTTLARQLATSLQAMHLRIDTIEQTLRRQLPTLSDIGPLGYQIAQAIAVDNLRLGQRVIADSVNPIEHTRMAWHDCARQAGKPWVDILLVCSDQRVHRHRIETRTADIPGHILPDWPAVRQRTFEPCDKDCWRFDTAQASVEDIAAQIMRRIATAEDRSAASQPPSGG